VSVVDSHCHLDDEKFDEDREAVIDRALAAGVDAMLAIGTGNGPPNLECALRLAEQYPFFYATVGVHPHDAAKTTDETFRRLRDLAAHPKVVGIGEIGLDYHYDFSPCDMQRAVFEQQLAIAREVGKPVVIHTREAWEDTFRLLGSGQPGIMHCFSGGPEEARRSLALGFHLSFSGIVTYPKALDVQEAARITPLDRLLVETDAPYLAPVPNRGKRNEPAFVIDTARRLAALKEIEFDELARATSLNFRRLCLRIETANG
jgi:TatD DNase family protein